MDHNGFIWVVNYNYIVNYDHGLQREDLIQQNAQCVSTIFLLL